MELQIQDLVTTIKKDGIDAARAEADQIISEAKKQASSIIADAKEEAERIRKKAESDIEIMKESVKVTAEHAKRDAVLFFKESVKEEYEKILSADISKSVKGEALVQLILAAINEEDGSNYRVEVAEVTDGLKSALAEKVRAGLEIKANPNIRSGFRLAEQDGSGYFDCSDEEISKMLKPFFHDLQI